MERDKILKIIDEVIEKSVVDQLEIVLSSKDYGLTRFAGNEIHQNMAEEDSYINVRVFNKNKIGACSTNKLDPRTIAETVKAATDIAELNNELPNFPGFAGIEEITKLKESPFLESTAKTGVVERGDLADKLISDVETRGFEASGAVENGTYFTAVTTSSGQQVFQEETSAKLNMVVNRPGKTGYGTGLARWIGRDISDLDCLEMSNKAVDISTKNENSESLSAGEYDVILTPEAVGLLLYYLSWMGLHSRAFSTGQSFMTDRIGEQVLSNNLSIWDDGLDCRGLAIPFDWEGRPKRRVDFIRNGIAEAVVYDSATGVSAGRKSTGHALSPLRDSYYSSPLPSNLFIGTGDTSVEEMVESSQKAIFINSLWYVREVHWKKATVTGMTRDGTFLIENGKISRALHNLRFTQSIVQAFNNVISVGDKAALTDQFIGSAFVPALKIGKFNIVGASSF